MPMDWGLARDYAARDVHPEETRVTEVAEELLHIDMRLRFALFGLECALGVSFSGTECERVFQDTNKDHVSTKQG
jgi:hypothetical protein